MGADHQAEDGSWIDFAIRPERAIDRAVSAGKLFEPWAILILIEWLPITVILTVAAERTVNPNYFLVVAATIVVGLFLVSCLQTFLMFGCLWIFTRVFGARERNRDFAISYAVASRGPACASSILILIYGAAVIVRGPTEATEHSNWALYIGVAFFLMIAVWYGWLASKAIRAAYDIPKFGVIFTVVVGGFVLPAFIPTDWMSAPFVGSYSMGAGSMRPVLEGRDHILTNNAAYGIRSSLLGEYLILLEAPGRGDIVVFESPESGEEYLKRVVAVAGDRIAVIKNQLVINDKPIPLIKVGEHWYNQEDEEGRFMGRERMTRWMEKLSDTEYPILHKYCESRDQCFRLGYGACDQENKTCIFPDFHSITVPENHVFVLGDNRHNSRDSRFFGCVPIDNVKGQVLLRYLPFGRAGVIQTAR